MIFYIFIILLIYIIYIYLGLIGEIIFIPLDQEVDNNNNIEEGLSDKEQEDEQFEEE